MSCCWYDFDFEYIFSPVFLGLRFFVVIQLNIDSDHFNNTVDIAKFMNSQQIRFSSTEDKKVIIQHNSVVHVSAVKSKILLKIMCLLDPIKSKGKKTPLAKGNEGQKGLGETWLSYGTKWTNTLVLFIVICSLSSKLKHEGRVAV